MDAFVAGFARVVALGGRAFVVIGDSAVGKQVITGDVAIRRAAERCKLVVPAAAVQVRPSFYQPAAQKTRREHLLLLTR